MSEKRHACPKCGRDDGLYRRMEVPGWQRVDPFLKKTGGIETEDFDAEPTGEYGCGECQWEGFKLETVGLDGEPLPFIHPNQLTIE